LEVGILGGGQHEGSESALVGVAMLGLAGAAHAQEQFIPMAGYWVGPYAAGLRQSTRRVHRLPEHDTTRATCGVNGVKRHLREVRDLSTTTARGVECYERLKNKGPTGLGVPHAVDGITYSIIDKAHADKIPCDLDRLRPHRPPPTARVPLHLPAGHELLVAEHRPTISSSACRHGDGQAQGQEDREHRYHDSGLRKET